MNKIMNNRELIGIKKWIIYNDTVYYIVFVNFYGECYGTKNGEYINLYKLKNRYKDEIIDEDYREIREKCFYIYDKKLESVIKRLKENKKCEYIEHDITYIKYLIETFFDIYLHEDIYEEQIEEEQRLQIKNLDEWDGIIKWLITTTLLFYVNIVLIQNMGFNLQNVLMKMEHIYHVKDIFVWELLIII